MEVTHDVLFQCEDVVIEELVQFLVRIVDAQLFERVDIEIFETENVQHAQKSARIFSRIRTRVDVLYQPGKRFRIQRFGHGVSVLFRFLDPQRNFGDVASDVDLSLEQHLLHLFRLQAQQCRDDFDDLSVRCAKLTVFAVHILELQIAEPQYRRQRLKNALAHVRGHLQYVKGQS